MSSLFAEARAKAMDTARIAFAPIRPLFSVPSISIILLSNFFWSNSPPTKAFLISIFTLETALRTPFPPYLLLSPSLSSIASLLPVDAPDGTAARPNDPSFRTTSASTVGFPLESRISLAIIFEIFGIYKSTLIFFNFPILWISDTHRIFRDRLPKKQALSYHITRRKFHNSLHLKFWENSVKINEWKNSKLSKPPPLLSLSKLYF